MFCYKRNDWKIIEFHEKKRFYIFATPTIKSLHVGIIIITSAKIAEIKYGLACANVIFEMRVILERLIRSAINCMLPPFIQGQFWLMKLVSVLHLSLMKSVEIHLFPLINDICNIFFIMVETVDI